MSPHAIRTPFDVFTRTYSPFLFCPITPVTSPLSLVMSCTAGVSHSMVAPAASALSPMSLSSSAYWA